MTLESATYLNQLVSTNPTGSDQKAQGDDHIRLLKAVLQATFPNVNGAVNPTPAELNYLVGVTSAVQTQLNASNGLALVSTQIASASTALEFTVDDTYRSLIFEIDNIIPSSTGQGLCLQQSVAAAYITASYKYASMYLVAGVPGFTELNSIVATRHTVSAEQSNSAGNICGTVRLYSPGVAGSEKVVTWDTLATVGANGATLLKGSGTNASNTGALDKVKFFFSSGNITSGTIRMYGMRK